MYELRSEIEIGAPAERVWRILTDFGAYVEWNPFIRRAAGTAKVGQKLKMYVSTGGALGMTFRPTVLEATPNRQLRWLGQVGFRGLFDGEHIFTIEALGPERIRLVQREVLKGLFVPVYARTQAK